MKKRRCIVGLLVIMTCVSLSVYHVKAEEKITKVSAILYSVQDAGVYTAPDVNLKPVVLLPANAPVEVTGITDNGWFQVNINGTYYIMGIGLVEPTKIDGNPVDYSDEAIQKMTAGSFTYYSTRELGEITRNDVLDMDENTYLRYMDSYLRGNGAMAKCIMKDTGLTLAEYVQGKKEANPSLASKTEKEMLVDYRLQYLQNSLEGPFRTSKALYLSMTRAIRYKKTQYTVKWKNASVADKEEKMKEIVDENVERIQKEQGVIFSYKLSYENDYWNIQLKMK